MRADELRFAEAIAALTARLESWGVEDPHAKAQQYVTDMRRNGWRPSGPREVDPPPTGAVSPPTDDYRQARLSCRTGGESA